MYDRTHHNDTWATAWILYVVFFALRFAAAKMAHLAEIALQSTHLSWQLAIPCAAMVALLVDHHSLFVQAASTLAFRILTTLMVRPYFRGMSWATEEQQRQEKEKMLHRHHRFASFSRTPSTASSVSGSEASSSTWSGKEVSSYRIPDRKLRTTQNTASSSRRTLRQQQQQQQQLLTQHRPFSNNAYGAKPQYQQYDAFPTSPRSPLTFTLSVPSAPSLSSSPSLKLRRKQSSSLATAAVPVHTTTSTTTAKASEHQQTQMLSPPPTPHSSRSWPVRCNTTAVPPSLEAFPLIGGDLFLDDEERDHNQQQSEEEQPPMSPLSSSSLASFTAMLKLPPTPSLPFDMALRRWPSVFRSASSFSTATAATAAAGATTNEVEEGDDQQVLGPQSHAQASHSHRYYAHGQILSPHRPSLERVAAAARMELLKHAGPTPGRVMSCSSNAVHNDNEHGCSHSPSHSALASLGLDGDCPDSIRSIVTDDHLIQLGALLGERATEEVMCRLNIAPACTTPGSLCVASSFDCTTSSSDSGNDGDGDSSPLNNNNNSVNAWQPCAGDHRPGLHMNAQRLLLRNGLYVYKTTVFLEGIDAGDVRPFHVDDAARELWDDGALEVRRATPPGCSKPSKHAESCMHSYLSRFPGPMAPRRYEYARRVWHRPADNGCYSISIKSDVLDCTDTCYDGDNGHGRKSCTRNGSGRREVEVLDFTSATVIRSAPGGCEIATLYFEDSQVRPGLAKVGVPKGLWPFWTKYEAALRLFVDARKTLHHHASPPTATAIEDTNEDEDDGEGSDDEVYGALAELKAAHRARHRRRSGGGGGGALGASSRWARRLVIAGAVKMMHVMLVASN